eukprot:3527592-Karenia_brevis.AAC.1
MGSARLACYSENFFGWVDHSVAISGIYPVPVLPDRGGLALPLFELRYCLGPGVRVHSEF